MIKDKINVISIAPDKKATITIGGAFYPRLNKLLMEYGEGMSKERMLIAVEKIKHDQIGKDNFAYNLETLIILIRDIEKAFQEQGQTTNVDVDIELPDDYRKNS